MTADHASGSYRWAVVGLLWLVCFFNYADRQAIFSVFPLLKQELHLSDVQLALAGSSFMWMYALFGPLAGWLGDQFSRKWLIIGALVFWSAVTAATASSHSIYDLALWRGLGGLGEAFYFPAAMSLLSNYHSAATRSRAMACHQSAVYAGSIAGATVSGYVGEHYGWRFSFGYFGAGGLLIAILLVLLLREPARPVTRDTRRSGFLRSAGSIFSNRTAVLLILAFIGANFVAVVFLSWLPSFLHDKFNLTLSGAGWDSTAYLQIASVCGVLLGGVLAGRAVRGNRSGRIRTQAIGLLCGVPFVWICGQTLSRSTLLVSLASFGLFKGIYDANIFASLHDVVDADRRAGATGLMNSLGWLGGGLAPLVIAFLSMRMTMSSAISLTALIYLVTSCLLFFAARDAVIARGDP